MLCLTQARCHLEGGHPCTGGDKSVVRRQHADNLLDEETLAGTGAAREKHVLAGAHGVQNVPGELFFYALIMQVKTD